MAYDPERSRTAQCAVRRRDLILSSSAVPILLSSSLVHPSISQYRESA